MLPIEKLLIQEPPIGARWTIQNAPLADENARVGGVALRTSAQSLGGGDTLLPDDCLMLGESQSASVLRVNATACTAETAGKLVPFGSVYALGFSTDERVLGAATRARFNHGALVVPSSVEVFLVQQDRIRSTNYTIFESSGVQALGFLDDLLLLACGDGSIKLFPFMEKTHEPRRTVQAHEGAVVSLIRAGRTIATLGADGVVKIWDPADWTTLQQADPIALPNHAAMILLAYDPTRERVLWGDGSGTIHTLDVNNGKRTSNRIHEGDVVAVAYHPDTDQVVTAGLHDNTLNLLEPGTHEIQTTRRTTDGLLGLVPLTNGLLACIGPTCVSFLRLPSLRPIGTSIHVKARSWAGPSPALHATKKLRERKKQIELLCIEIDDLIKQREFEQAEQRFQQAWDHDLVEFPVMNLLARLYRYQGRYVDELSTLSEIRDKEGDSLSLGFRYVEAANLQRIGEPTRAAMLFRSLGQFEDASEQALACERDPRYERDSFVRSDLTNTLERVPDEIRKDGLLTQAFTTPTAIVASVPKPMSVAVSIDDITRALDARSREYASGPWTIWTERRDLYDGEVCRPVKWLRIRRERDGHAAASLEAGFTIEVSAVGTTSRGFLLFVPGTPSSDIQEWNERMRARWRELSSDADEREWFRQVYRLVTSVLARLQNRRRATRQ